MSLLPHAYAQGISSVAQVQQTGKLIEAINSNIVGALGVLLLALTIIAFFAGVVRFIWALREGDIKAAENGKRFMLWSLLAVFVVFSIYGIIIFMQMTLLGKRSETTIGKPCLNFVSGCPDTSTYSPQYPTGGTPSDGGWGTGGGVVGGVAQTAQSACIGKTGNGAPCVLNGSAGTCQVVNANYVCIPTPTGGTSSSQCSVGTFGQGCQILGKTGTCKYDDSNGGYYCSTASTGSVMGEDVKCEKEGDQCFSGSQPGVCEYVSDYTGSAFICNTTATLGKDQKDMSMGCDSQADLGFGCLKSDGSAGYCSADCRIEVGNTCNEYFYVCK